MSLFPKGDDNIGQIGPTATEVREREQLIERWCRAYCREIGVDPDERTSFGSGDDDTAQERAMRGQYWATADVLLHGPRWRLYRGRVTEFAALMNAVR